MLYVFQGDDEYGRTAAVNELKAKLGDPATAGMNTVILDGRKLRPEDLARHCRALPFMAPARLVVVRGLLERIRGHPEQQKRLLRVLDGLPDTTWLVLEEKSPLPPHDPVLKLAKKWERSGRARILTFENPKGAALIRWIEQKADEEGVAITPEAAQELAACVGENLRLMEQELDKLAAYVDWSRPITLEDVNALVSYSREATVFAMLDAIGAGNASGALRLLRDLLEKGEHPLRILAMVVRQVRILILVKYLLARGRSARQIAGRLKLHPYVVDKAIRQSRKFSMRRLQAIYRRLLEVDVEVKTGQIEGPVLLELLVTALST